MKFRISKASGKWETPEGEIEIDTLEQLLAYVESQDCEVILYPPDEGNTWHIRTYDDYIE